MRILIISDIHANLEALEACLQAAPAFDRVFNLGDVVGYGANPNEVIDRSRQMGEVFVRGNHDKACSGITGLAGFNPIAGMAARWTQQTLTPDNRNFLRAMPQGPIAPFENVACVHGSSRDEDEYVLVPKEAYPLLDMAPARVTFFGHTHVQCGFASEASSRYHSLAPSYNGGRGPQTFQLHLRADAKYLINPGSVGQPRDSDPRAAFVLYDSSELSLTFYRVPYDIAAAQKKIYAAGLPDRLAERLAEGR